LQGDITGGTYLLQVAQNTTSSFTQSYAWIDQTGNSLANSNYSYVTLFQENHLNDTNRPYFKGARETGRVFVSDAITALAPNIIVIVIAQPIYSADHNFEGVIASTIDISALAPFIKNQLAPSSRPTLDS
jgi:C4-dicarboxylate-specific signal transduction histidine kinase